MTITITTAPCCWGVDDVKNPNLPAWERVFDEAAAAGYGGLELGPYGYVPLESERVVRALDERKLFIVAGTIFDDLVAPENQANLLRQTEEICAVIAQLPQPEQVSGQRFRTPYLTVMDWGHDERDYAAGHCERAPRLANEAWVDMVANIRAIAALARDKYGVRAVIHPHAGGYIEFGDEIERIAKDVPAELAGFCIDTGHTYYAGMDPTETLKTYADRLDYVHFKDIDEKVFRRVLGEKIRFFEACAQGVMCPIGRGVIDYPAIKRTLEEIGYHGFITVEQERDPLSVSGSLADVKESRDYLRSVGF
ncbi:Inosose dehydratase (plasmid) [Sinorhizobium sojae CCBAU 05684]|uniref:Inosose dehydratase n=1 Tax=Sinorhizobium sojae CCBAU 05684 TaxID=716928 RepID=A0A249PHC9_9HYPH|nr:TIM barrel protein [Sinorhizobium sojae]ASY65321.1 Inosose dehydratase [Sinorhizobium sojae CCBAU 05684]